MIKNISLKSLSSSKCKSTVFALALATGVILGSMTSITAYATEEAMPAEIISDEEFEYRVMFIDYDGTELYSELLPEGSGIVEPVVPERIGFTFVGWAPEVDPVVPAQDVVYTAQYFQVEDVADGYEAEDATVVYDSALDDSAEIAQAAEGVSGNMDCTGEGHFTNFLFMVILFLMETAWLQDRRSQQMKRYDTLMDQVDKE